VKEVKYLVAIHTNLKGSISWIKMMEAWNLLELSTRSKVSLRSKWSDIKSRPIVLDLAQDQNGTGLCGTYKTIMPQQQLVVNAAQLVSKAVKSPKRNSPVATTSGPSPIQNNVNLVKADDCALLYISLR
jgi:hypothetical protein